jgi:starch phosphorylase
VIIFAGKAHPKDHPGQQLIKVIHELSMRPEFIGRIILIEGYDLALARKLVSGVDVWLNTPEHPLEASGTSGEKAAVNGAINLSILDGWWGEGYNGSNGWGIKPRSSRFEADYRNREEADDLLDIIEHEMMPLYYQRDGRGYSEGWVQMSKASMKSIIPRFNAQRMVMDYVRNFYAPAKENGLRMGESDAEPARRLAEWKARVSEAWSGVTLELLEAIPSRAFANETIPLRVGVNLNGLAPGDVVVECLVGTSGRDEGFEANSHFTLKPQSAEGESVIFALDLEPPLSGLQQIKLRAYPHHPLLTHRFEVGLMRWV